jgi:hypothetical protein
VILVKNTIKIFKKGHKTSHHFLAYSKRSEQYAEEWKECFPRGKRRNAYRILVEKPEGKRQLGKQI